MLWYSATGFEPNDTFFSHGGFFSPIDRADLAVEMTGPESADPNDTVSYQIAVTNHGPSFATDVELRDVMTPAGAQFVAASSSADCTLPAFNLVVCTLGDIRPGTTVPLTVTFRPGPHADASLINQVVVRESRQDPNPTNDRAKVTTALVP